MNLTGIVAMTPERVIGRDGQLPWHLPEDLSFFKKTTTGHPIVMGRQTFQSIGRPLPKRRNLVLTRNPDWSAPGVEAVSDPTALDTLGLDGEVFIIGGAQIYREFLPRLDTLLVSLVFQNHPGDTYFPAFAEDFPNHEVIECHRDFEVRRYRRLNPAL